MATKKAGSTRKVAAKKKVGRPSTGETKQVWFRLTEAEMLDEQQEAADQGRTMAGHLRWLYLQSRKARGKD
jgi:hypothetical protein